MIIYEVNLSVQEKAAEDFKSWLREHVREMLAFEGFVNAEILTQRPDDMPEAEPGRCYWTVLYRMRDRSALDNYLAENALPMRQKGMTRFPGLKAWRRILEGV